MKEVKAHIQAMQQGWKGFQATNAGFDLVRFWPETRADGVFGVAGYLTSQVQLVQLETLLSNTHPPRPLYLEQLKLVDAERFAFESEHWAWRSTNSEPNGLLAPR